MEQENKEKIKEEKTEVKAVEKPVEKKAEAKPKTETKPKATKVIAIGRDMPISMKYSAAVCSAIRNRKTEIALKLLEQVVSKKRALPMKGEMAHHHVVGSLTSRPSKYPVKASIEFIKLIKSLNANASVKGLDPSELIITKAMANKASRPFKGTRLAFGRKRFKRSNVLLEGAEAKIKSAKKSQDKKLKK
jgi:large subunit ribosomal protein L22